LKKTVNAIWTFFMPDLFDSFIDKIEKAKRQLEEVVQAYRTFKEKLDALPPELASEAMQLLHGPLPKSEGHVVPEILGNSEVIKQDLVGIPALRCCRAILDENGNQPLHYGEIARQAMARGYRGRSTEGTAQEIRIRTINSFWAAISRSEDFEAVGGGRYRIRDWGKNPAT
jgi:HB1, ASXL, restriction endonuclease HTH domain